MKGSDLGAVLTFMPIVRVDEKIIQSIALPVPREGSILTERFRGKLRHHGHDLGMRVVVLSYYSLMVFFLRLLTSASLN